MSLQCDLCKQDYSTIYWLVCFHKLCKTCLGNNTKVDIVQCPKESCGLKTDSKTVKKKDSLSEILVSIKEEKLLNTASKYLDDLEKRELNIVEHIIKFKRDLENNELETTESTERLDKLYKQREKELKDHFEKLENFITETSFRQRESLNNLICLMTEMKEELRRQREAFRLFIEVNKENANTTETCAVIERQLLNSKSFKLDASELVVKFMIDDNWKVADDISISPPEITLTRMDQVSKLN